MHTIFHAPKPSNHALDAEPLKSATEQDTVQYPRCTPQINKATYPNFFNEKEKC